MKAGTEQAKEMNAAYAVLKETEKTTFRPGSIVERMRANGPPRFNLSHHTNLWKAEDAKAPRKDLGVEIDRVALHGSGEGAEPQGLAGADDVAVVALGTNGAALTHASVISLETAMARANADSGQLGYITNAKVRGKLRQTYAPAVTAEIPLWGGTAGARTLNGHPARVTNNVSSTLTSPYDLQDRLPIPENLVIPEPQDMEPVLPQRPVPLPVSLGGLHVLSAVELDHQPPLERYETSHPSGISPREEATRGWFS